MGHSSCLAHLAPTDRAAYLGTLSPGHDVDHRGTEFTASLLDELLDAFREPDGLVRFGRAWFDGATFASEARFDGATFLGEATFIDVTFSADARFDGATFSADARFSDATFSDIARFDDVTFSEIAGFMNVRFASAQFGGATFSGIAWFDSATFSDIAWFGGATFSDIARFDDAAFNDTARFVNVTFASEARFGATFSAALFEGSVFSGDAKFFDVTFSDHAGFGNVRFSAAARFDGVTFSNNVWFDGATFSDDAWFGGATFSAAAEFDGAVFSADAMFNGATFPEATRLGPLVCGGALYLSGATFGKPVTIEAAAAAVICMRTGWESTATLRLRYATVDLSDAVVTQPIAVTAHTAPFANDSGIVIDETGFAGDASVRISSLRGVDAAHLVLTNTDLSECRFFGAFHLDQLRLEGETVFARTPCGTDVRRAIPLRWTDRLALAEEHHWRAQPNHRPRLRAGWIQAPPGAGPAVCPPGPPALAALYRQLRKAFEDGKDEPGAADFYYAEMEMRRLGSVSRRARAERGLLTAYWALSGYGLRASRALIWLGFAMTVTILALMMWGLPTHDPKSRTTGTLPATGQALILTTDTPDPVITGPVSNRFTGKRAKKATRIAVNSVVFRASGQNLTAIGGDIEMASRLFEPVLLGLAALAIRGRVKR
ncbi:pentapeptide repeat-containing protein [Streptomyces sp. NPDC047718]|uniref:pentapeptide repeat-containing protein n=1 Tax=Streptomyces sp. NPDC047718 TaxID=3155479 RepID=UPI0033E8C145